MLRSDIATSTLCLDAVTSAVSLLEQYNTTLSTLLDKHGPVLTRTVMIRPKVPYFKGDIKKKAKQKRRQSERRWRQSRLTITVTSSKNRDVTSINSSPPLSLHITLQNHISCM